MTDKKTSTKPRNPAARSPLMKKGGVHEKTKTSKRRSSKESVKGDLEDWRDDVKFERSVKNED
jgi:hypothetical protein